MLSWSPKRIAPSAHRQKQLILKTFDLLADGGVLIYSTCTFAPEENEARDKSTCFKERPTELEQVEIPISACARYHRMEGSSRMINACGLRRACYRITTTPAASFWRGSKND